MTALSSPPQYRYTHVHYEPPFSAEAIKQMWWFSESLLEDCASLLPPLDNYALERLLIKSGVIGIDDRFESDEDEIVVNFTDRQSAHAFIDRLNAFLVRLWKGTGRG